MGLSAVISFFTHHHLPSLLNFVLNLFHFHLILTVFTFRWTLYMRRQHKLQSHFQILLGRLIFWHLLGCFHTLAGSLAAHQMWKWFIVYHFSASTVHTHIRLFIHWSIFFHDCKKKDHVLMTAYSLNGIASVEKRAHRRLILSAGYCFLHPLHVLPWANNIVWNWSTAAAGK